MSEEDLVAILDVARSANEQHNVTGMLVYSDGVFLQALEGAPEAVNTLLDNISKDARHTCMLEILREDIPQRNFSQWTMGFSHAHELNRPGLESFLTLDQDKRYEQLKSPDFARQLLA